MNKDYYNNKQMNQQSIKDSINNITINYIQTLTYSIIYKLCKK
jgi:hypothetical protein